MKIGLKLGSDSIAYFDSARELKEKGYFDYIELFIIPGSEIGLAEKWKSLEVPFILHAPHSLAGMNPSLPEMEQANLKCIAEVSQWAQAMDAVYVIYHAGLNGTLDESIRQFKAFKWAYPRAFENALIENKPKVGINRESCIGYDTAQVKRLMGEIGFGFCLDFGHALCAAFSLRADEEAFLRDFLVLKPALFHLSDNIRGQETDGHMHLGQGSLDLPRLLTLIPEQAMVSLEVRKDSKSNLDDFLGDVEYLNRIKKAA